MQGNFSYGGGSYLDELKSYLTARLLRDDAKSVNEIIQESFRLLNKALEFTTNKERVYRLLISIEYLYLVRLEMDYSNRNKLIDEFKEKKLKLRITEIFERTELNYSIEIMKESRYAIDRKDWYSLYYIMR